MRKTSRKTYSDAKRKLPPPSPPSSSCRLPLRTPRPRPSPGGSSPPRSRRPRKRPGRWRLLSSPGRPRWPPRPRSRSCGAARPLAGGRGSERGPSGRIRRRPKQQQKTISLDDAQKNKVIYLVSPPLPVGVVCVWHVPEPAVAVRVEVGEAVVERAHLRLPAGGVAAAAGGGGRARGGVDGLGRGVCRSAPPASGKKIKRDLISDSVTATRLSLLAYLAFPLLPAAPAPSSESLCDLLPSSPELAPVPSWW